MAGSLEKDSVTGEIPVYEERVIPISKLKLDPDDNVRKQPDEAAIEGLAQALQRDGRFMQAPRVYLDADGFYRPIFGSQRVRAALRARHSRRGQPVEELPVIVEPAPKDRRALMLDQMQENDQRSPLGPVDRAIAFRFLMKNEHMKADQILAELAERGMKRSKSWLAKIMAMPELAPEVQEMVNRGSDDELESLGRDAESSEPQSIHRKRKEQRGLGMTLAYELRDLPADKQVEWARRILAEGINQKQLRAMLEAGGLTAPSRRSRLQAELLADAQNEAALPLEAQLLELDDQISERAQSWDEESRRNAARRPVDPARQDGRVAKSYVLLARSRQSYRDRPAPSLTELVAKGALPELEQALNTTDDNEVSLAQEFLLAGCTPAEAVELTKKAQQEISQATSDQAAVMNLARRLVEGRISFDEGSALAVVLRARLNDILKTLK